jgi:hypothetical protein
MANFDWKSIVRTVAPSAAMMLGGPLAGMAIKALGDKLLGNNNATQDAVADAVINASPADLVKLKEVEADLKKSLADAGVQIEKIAADDRNSARQLEVQTKSYTPSILSYCILGASTAAFLGVICGNVTIPTDPQTAVIYGSVLTFLVTESKAILGYWFGSSSGSQNKDDTIASIAKQP